MRLDNFLNKALNVSRSEASKIIKNKQITINDKVVVKKDTYIDEQKDVIKYNNQIIEYKLPNSTSKESDYWLVKSISTDVSTDGTQTINAMRYYAEYA